MDKQMRVRDDRLLDFAAAVYVRAGMPEADARLAADTLVQADLWGHQSHGVMRLSWYVARLKAGVVKPVAEPEIVTDAGAVAVMDGRTAMGQVLTALAMQDAIAGRRLTGSALRASQLHHFGTAMYFTLMAAAEGCVGFLSTNASPAMAPWGGRRRPSGPIPGRGLLPPAASRRWSGHRQHRRGPGQDLFGPAEGASDPGRLGHQRGRRADHRSGRGHRGIILPMAEHKGYAIAVMMDMLSGILTGSAFGAGVHGPYQTGIAAASGIS